MGRSVKLLFNMMNNLSSELQAFGLTDHESQVYLNLLQYSPQTALSLSRSLPINRTTLYRLLQHLQQLGLVQEILSHKTTRYSASSPEKLKLVLQNKQIELDSLHQSLTSLLPQLQQLTTSSTSPTKVLYYQGIEGLKQVLYNTLSATTEVVGYGYLDWNQGIGHKYAEFLRQEYVDRHLKSREILNTATLSFTSLSSYLGLVYSSRLISPHQLKITHDTYIYNNVTAFYHLFNNEYFGLEIHSPDITSTQRQIFDLLWSLARSP